MSADKKIDYNSFFKGLYYSLYSNSNTSRAERIVSDITKILLCKLMMEEDKYLSEKQIDETKLLKLLKTRYPQSCEQFDDFSMTKKDIEYCLEYLSSISLSNSPAHIIGDAFQSIIGPNIRGDKGQFFTPKELVNSIVKIVNPKTNSIILDPACGTGGFLTEAYINSQDTKNFKLIGIDKDKDMADIALATTEIISKGTSQIYNKNSLEILNPKNELYSLLGTVDYVLTNPPFGSKIGITDSDILKFYDFGYNWTYSESNDTWIKLNTLSKNQVPQVLFIELCIKLLKNDGIMAMVLPEGIFGNKSLGYIWSYLKQNGNVIGMLDCPRNTFQPSTDTKTNVLFFQKGKKFSNEILIAIAKSCGHDKRGRTLTVNKQPIKNDFALIAEDYCNKRNIFWKIAKLEGNYFVPRYLVEKTLISAKKNDNYISIGEMINKGMLKKKSGKEIGSEAYGSGKIPFVRTSDIINFEIAADPTNSVSEEIYSQYSKQQNLEIGDILFIADGRYRIGKTAIITENNIKCLIQSHIEILSLTKEAPFTSYEFLYLLNTKEVQEQVRSLVFIQSTLGTLGERLKEIYLPIPKKTEQWTKTILSFKKSIELRAKYLNELQNTENSYEL